MNKEIIESAILAAMDSHIKDGGLITAPNKLRDRIMMELGLSDSFEYEGWVVHRVVGSDKRFGKKTHRNSRGCYGFISTKNGFADEAMPPASGYDVPLSSLHQMLELRNKMGN